MLFDGRCVHCDVHPSPYLMVPHVTVTAHFMICVTNARNGDSDLGGARRGEFPSFVHAVHVLGYRYMLRIGMHP